MKCSVCGYEFDESRGECPLCGTPAAKRPSTREPVEINFSSVAESFAAPKRIASDEEIVWNTFDFPKPRTVENIEVSFKDDSSEPAEAISVNAEASPSEMADTAAADEMPAKMADTAAADEMPSEMADAAAADEAPAEAPAADDSFFDDFDESIDAPAESFISQSAEASTGSSEQTEPASPQKEGTQPDTTFVINDRDDAFRPFEIPDFLEPEDISYTIQAPMQVQSADEVVKEIESDPDNRYGLYNELSGVLFKDYDNEDGLTAEELFEDDAPQSDGQPDYTMTFEPAEIIEECPAEPSGMPEEYPAEPAQTDEIEPAEIIEEYPAEPAEIIEEYPAEPAEISEEYPAEPAQTNEIEPAEIIEEYPAEPAEIPEEYPADEPAEAADANTEDETEESEQESEHAPKKKDIFFNWIARAEEIFSSKSFDHVRVDKKTAEEAPAEAEQPEASAEDAAPLFEAADYTAPVEAEQPEASAEDAAPLFEAADYTAPAEAEQPETTQPDQPETMSFELPAETDDENDDDGEVLTIESILSGSFPNDIPTEDATIMRDDDEEADDDWLDQQRRRSPLEAFGMTQHSFADGTKPGDEKFFTFAKKNDEFQSLLNKEYERLRAIHSDETVVDIISIAKENPRDAELQSIRNEEPEETKIFLHSEIKASGREAALSGEQTAPGKQRLGQSETGADSDSDGNLVEVSSAIGAEAFTKNTVETKIAEMKAAEEAEAFRRSEHRKHLEEMKKAREAYFARQDEESGFKLPESESSPAAGAPVQNDDAADKSDEQGPEPDQNRDSKKITRSIEDEVSVLVRTVTQEFKEQDFSNRIKSIVYSNKDDDEPEIEYRKGHPLLTFLLVIVIVIAVVELICIGCRHFIPDMPITNTLTQLEQAFKDAFINLWGSIKRLFVRISQGK